MCWTTRDEQQVRPLLPAGPASLVIVTSRNRLAGLAAVDGAQLLGLDLLAPNEAVRLLTARLGGSRAGAEIEAVSEIASLCACLPLALAVAAARAAARPGLALATLAAELRDASGRLNALDAGDPAASVAAVFSGPTSSSAPARRACSGCWACIPAPTSAPAPRPAWPPSTSRKPAGCCANSPATA